MEKDRLGLMGTVSLERFIAGGAGSGVSMHGRFLPFIPRVLLKSVADSVYGRVSLRIPSLEYQGGEQNSLSDLLTFRLIAV